MATTKTVSTNTTHTIGKCVLVSHSAVVAPSMGGNYSLHDCATPGAAEIWNCVYPINFASADGKTFQTGLTVVHRNPNDPGTVSVTVA
jgi:hypothetical protein